MREVLTRGMILLAMACLGVSCGLTLLMLSGCAREKRYSFEARGRVIYCNDLVHLDGCGARFEDCNDGRSYLCVVNFSVRK